MPVSIRNIRLNPEAVEMVRTGTDIEPGLPGIGMPVSLGCCRDPAEIMLVSPILRNKQIRQIAK